MEYGYIYITTNSINGKRYIGQHKGTFDSNYLGSGIYLLRAIKKYGKKYFSTKIIKYCKDLNTLNEEEIQYIKKYGADKSNKFYNIASGGLGNTGNSGKPKSIQHRKRLSEARKGFIPSEETNKKISEANSGERHWNYSRTRSAETRQKISDSLTGKNHPNYGRRGKGTPMYGKKHSTQTKNKMSKSHKGKTHTDESKRKISKAKTGMRQKNITCPHCNKVGGIANMKRYHLNNCKMVKK